ncbi:ribosome biogenesis protein Nop53/GLTSCR2 [Scheffersomyces amazonensis]|uniref:ribosome biogenesis protein Nop53/GLTSCR2 n=1 Tax=Scheffersomyces amazonensis TaxID=1078765 RepID=UPI00315D344D
MSQVKKVGKPQTSRKGKKAWRKNIDIEDVESGLEQAREEEIIIGKKKTNKSQDSNEEEVDFIIDDKPSVSIINKAQVKKLKSTEILTNKSKVPALISKNKKQDKKNNTIQGVKRTELLRLIKLNGGKYKEESKILNRIEKDGLINVENRDIWGSEEVQVTPVSNFSSTAEVTQAKVVPKTLKYQPVKIIENDLSNKIIDAGKSYNPSLESWKELINKEYSVEYKRELARQEIQDYQEKIKDLINTLDDVESDSDDDDDEKDEKDVKDDNEHISTNDENYKLSINKPTQIKIKTKTKRNKEARHKQRVKLEQELKDLKKQVQDLHKLDELLEKQQVQELEAQAEAEKKSGKKSTSVRKGKLFKYNAVSTPLEVKLSDELTSNLKNLKPEGNLFYDQMLSLQSTGKIETRIPVSKRRKYTPKVTEKWTYKDFK